MGNVALTPGDGRQLTDPFAPPQPGFRWAGQEQAEQGLDLTTIVRIIKEWRWLILGAGALGLLAAIILSLMTTPLYRAWVTLEVNPPTVEILDEKQREVASASTWDFIATQVGLLSSRSLAERVAQDLNLAANEEFAGSGGDAATRLDIAAAKVAGGLEVVPPEEGQLIRFSYVSESPQLAATIANGIAEGFIDASLQRRFDASAHARDFLQKQIAKTRSDLERSERQQVAYAQAQGIINTSTGEDGQPSSDVGSLQGASLVSLNEALAEATARRVQAEGAYRQAQLASGSAEVVDSTQGLRQSRASVEAEYQEKRTLMKPDHPDMLSLRNRIEELDRQIAQERSHVASSRATTLLAAYRAALAAENALRSRVAALKGSVLDLRGRSIQYNILQRDVDTNRGLYDALLARYKEIGVAGGVGTSPVSIVDRAEVPGGPFKPDLPFNMMAGLGLGLLAGLAAAVALEFLNDTIKTREDVRTKLGLACLGVIPRRRGKGAIVEDLQDTASPISEAYAAVLAALRFSTESGAPKTLLVTSSLASEGKSSSALALAQNYARRGERVLLIDADLRRPAFKGTSNRQGLTKLLTNDEPLQAHVVDTQYENLWLLPCGPTPPNPADLLSTPRFGSIVGEAREHFDRLIIDGPPTLGLADASLLSSAAGNVLLVVEAGKTRTRSVREAIERMQSSGAHILGVSLSKSAEEAGHYGYRYYHSGAIGQKRDEIIMISHQPES